LHGEGVGGGCQALIGSSACVRESGSFLDGTEHTS